MVLTFYSMAAMMTSEQWKEWLRAPLEHAAARGNTDLFTRLMDAGADGSAGWQGCSGRTLLGAAAHSGSEQMVLALLKARAKPDLNIRFGAEEQSALHVAAAQGAGVVSTALMLAGAHANSRDGKKRIPLHVAAEAAEGTHLSAVEELLAAGANVDIRCSGGRPVLDVAAHKAYEGVLRALLRHGCDIKACDVYGSTVLHYIAAAVTLGCVRDHSGVFRALLEAGADTEARTTMNYYHTPLHTAVSHQSAACDIILALLDGGADVNALSESAMTPLHLACAHSSVAGVELLLRWGA
ncbi:unnamed protein product, partial [Pylaiella littoralis]